MCQGVAGYIVVLAVIRCLLLIGGGAEVCAFLGTLCSLLGLVAQLAARCWPSWLAWGVVAVATADGLFEVAFVFVSVVQGDRASRSALPCNLPLLAQRVFEPSSVGGRAFVGASTSSLVSPR
mmetsp:Transcript_68891/g.149929  ORF Transcript_68891/g.149929 Transcript_68891/m.149929 type:complete len:122 (-) Transcript_68891:203-568(-)